MRIELRHIDKRFGPVQANDDISLTVEGGAIHGLLGENGAGKTTLMKILSGYLPADGGQILLDGRPVALASPEQALAAGIGMLHQDPMDVPALCVLDNFLLGRGGGFFAGRRAARRTFRGLCERFGYDLDPEAPVASLTVGERQQLEIARLLALGVQVIILDEPTTGISVPQKVLLFQTLKTLARQGLSIIFVSHKLGEVEALCTEATVLRDGQNVGHVEAPFSADVLVQMMFGRCLSAAERPRSRPGKVRVRLENVSAHTYRLRLEGISLELREGKVIGLAGLEGSGQRILMRVCAGIQPVAAGSIHIDGQEMTHQPYRRFLEQGVAYVPAARLEEGLISGLTLREHATLCAKVCHDAEQGKGRFFVDWAASERSAQAMIREYNIIGKPDTLVQELSGGNQQRALLALLPESLRLLILEHPTRGLDIASSRWMWSRLAQRQASGTTIMFTSTDLDELVENSDRIVVFSGGEMSPPVEAGRITCEELGYLIGGKRQ